jgi:hypothetical protein
MMRSGVSTSETFSVGKSSFCCVRRAKPSQLVCKIIPAKTKSVSPMHDGDGLVARPMFHNL